MTARHTLHRLALAAIACLVAFSAHAQPAAYPAGVVKLGLQAVWDLPATIPATRLAIPPDGPTTALANGTLDMTGATAARHAPIYVSGQFSADHVNFKNAPRDFLITFAGSSARISWSAFGNFGQATDVTDHLEPIQAYGGGFIWLDYTLIRADAPLMGGMSTTGLQMQTDVTTQVTLITNSVLADGRTLQARTTTGVLSTGAAPLSCKAVKADQFTLVSGSALEPSPAGTYVVKTELNGHRCQIFDMGGNVDALTGLPITFGPAIPADTRDALIAALKAQVAQDAAAIAGLTTARDAGAKRLSALAAALQGLAATAAAPN